MSSDNNPKTLWIGNIEPWMDESYVSNLFSKTAKCVSVKLIKDKQSNENVGYGFIEFESGQIAKKVYELFNGSINPSTNKPFRLNWGVRKTQSQGYVDHSSSTSGPISVFLICYFKVYVGGLDDETTKEELLDFFKKDFPSAFGSNIIINPATKTSKGYGFVQFTDEDEAQRAIEEKDGAVLQGCQLKVNAGKKSKKVEGKVQEYSRGKEPHSSSNGASSSNGYKQVTAANMGQMMASGAGNYYGAGYPAHFQPQAYAMYAYPNMQMVSNIF